MPTILISSPESGLHLGPSSSSQHNKFDLLCDNKILHQPNIQTFYQFIQKFIEATLFKRFKVNWVVQLQL